MILKNAMWILLAAMALSMLFGCATTATAVVKVPVPVACNQAEPQRPVMPTENFRAPPDVDEFVQGALAEIERREGYEGELREALRACIKPVG